MDLPEGWTRLSEIGRYLNADYQPSDSDGVYISEASDLLKEMAEAAEKVMGYYGHDLSPSPDPFAPGLFDLRKALNRFKEWK